MSRPPRHPLLDAATRLADDVLFPNAQDVDRAPQLPAGHLRAIADAGLFGLTDPELPGPSAAEARRIFAVMAGGCGATFFVWAQHHGVARAIGNSTNDALVEQWHRPLLRGERLAGVAFAHLRRAGAPAISAERRDGRWSLHGVAPWATSWGLADGFAVAAVAGNDVMWAMLPPHDSADRRYRASPLDLAVFASTGTVALHFDDVPVTDQDVIAIESLSAWRSADRCHAAAGAPAVLGVADRAIRLLGDTSDPAATDAASALAADLEALWHDDDVISACPPSSEDLIAAASDHRWACLQLGHRATAAYLAATGGRGMNLDHPAQRLVREAAFYVIQAQTADGRAAALRAAGRQLVPGTS